MPCPVAKTRLLYFPAPKVACTSIKRAVLTHNARMAGEIDPVLRQVHQISPTTSFHRLYPYRHLLKRWFCVVRDPVKRALSAYSNRILHHNELKDLPDEVLAEAGLSRQPELDEFIAKMPDYNRIHAGIDHHTRPLTFFLGDDPGRYHRIFDMSELGTLPDYLAEAGASGIELGHDQTGGPKIALADVPPAALETLRAFYAEDYRIWGDHLKS